VTTTNSKKIKAYAPRDAIIYRREEGEYVGDMMDGYGLPWNVREN
jgi:hypothetical protein